MPSHSATQKGQENHPPLGDSLSNAQERKNAKTGTTAISGPSSAARAAAFFAVPLFSFVVLAPFPCLSAVNVVDGTWRSAFVWGVVVDFVVVVVVRRRRRRRRGGVPLVWAGVSALVSFGGVEWPAPLATAPHKSTPSRLSPLLSPPLRPLRGPPCVFVWWRFFHLRRRRASRKACGGWCAAAYHPPRSPPCGRAPRSHPPLLLWLPHDGEATKATADGCRDDRHSSDLPMRWVAAATTRTTHWAGQGERASPARTPSRRRTAPPLPPPLGIVGHWWVWGWGLGGPMHLPRVNSIGRTR